MKKDPVQASIERFAADIIQRIVNVLNTADAGANNITVEVDGESLELYIFTDTLAKFAKDLRRRTP
jgi:hypothetical protein